MPPDMRLALISSAWSVGRTNVPEYLHGPSIPADPTTETFEALKLWVDNWRWRSVPFYLRSGKRMSTNLTEIAIRFKAPPTQVFRETLLEHPEPNWLLFRLRPDESIKLLVQAKQPGLELTAREVIFSAQYGTE